jgi:hypothetical protein
MICLLRAYSPVFKCYAGELNYFAKFHWKGDNFSSRSYTPWRRLMTCTVDVPSFFKYLAQSSHTCITQHLQHGAQTHTPPTMSPVALTSSAQCSLFLAAPSLRRYSMNVTQASSWPLSYRTDRWLRNLPVFSLPLLCLSLPCNICSNTCATNICSAVYLCLSVREAQTSFA